MARVASGKLRHRVALQAPTISQDATTGEPVTLWETIATPWAEIAPVSGGEFIAAGAEQSEVRGRMTIRYRQGVEPSMRVLHRDQVYNILAVLPDAESGLAHLTLMTSAGVRVDL